MGLYTRPILAEQEKSTVTGYHVGVGAVVRMIWLPKCNSMRTRLGRVEPEIYFRIVHDAEVGHQGTQVAPCREQMVEIALGPKGAFENGNIGALTRRMLPDKVVSAVPRLRGTPKPPKSQRTPKVVELLRKAIEWKTLLETGRIATQADIARQEGVTRARVTQIMGMLQLAPEIREHILSLPDDAHRPPITERILRPIETIINHRDQLREFRRSRM